MPEKNENNNQKDTDNPFLLLGFWEFAIISTLMVVFFPWSLLFCLIFYGLEYTKLLVIALFHDFVKTLLSVLSILFLVVIFILGLIYLFAG